MITSDIETRSAKIENIINNLLNKQSKYQNYSMSSTRSRITSTNIGMKKQRFIF